MKRPATRWALHGPARARGRVMLQVQDEAWGLDELGKELTRLLEALDTGPAAAVGDVLVEIAALLELAGEVPREVASRLDAERRAIESLDDQRSRRTGRSSTRPTDVRSMARLLPWELRRQARGWVWRPYTAEVPGLATLAEALDAHALAVHRAMLGTRGASGVTPAVVKGVRAHARAALADVESHISTRVRAQRCLSNLVELRGALVGEPLSRRPAALEEQAPDAVRAAARALVPLGAREAALQWFWHPHVPVNA